MTIQTSGEILVNTNTISEQSQPAVTTLKDGGWLVTWASLNQDGSGYGFFGPARFQGPAIAAAKGASAVVIRSVHRLPKDSRKVASGSRGVVARTVRAAAGRSHGAPPPGAVGAAGGSAPPQAMASAVKP